METTYSKNIKNTKKNTTHIKVMLKYSKGGFNCFTGKKEERGLYLIFQPIDIEGICESFTCFTGTKYLLKELHRYSKKEWDETLAKINGHEEEMAELYASGKEEELCGMLWS